MASIYTRLKNQYKFIYLTLLSASFYKISEDDQSSDKTDLFYNLNILHILTENDINDIDIKSQLEQQCQIQETKESGWILN